MSDANPKSATGEGDNKILTSPLFEKYGSILSRTKSP